MPLLSPRGLGAGNLKTSDPPVLVMLIKGVKDPDRWALGRRRGPGRRRSNADEVVEALSEASSDSDVGSAC